MAASIFETDYFVLHFPRHSSSFSLHQFSPSPPPLSLWWNRKCFPLCWRVGESWLETHMAMWTNETQNKNVGSSAHQYGQMHASRLLFKHQFHMCVCMCVCVCVCACVCACVFCVCVCVCVWVCLRYCFGGEYSESTFFAETAIFFHPCLASFSLIRILNSFISDNLFPFDCDLSAGLKFFKI
jgi:hypothetical protein